MKEWPISSQFMPASPPPVPLLPPPLSVPDCVVAACSRARRAFAAAARFALAAAARRALAAAARALAAL